MGAGDTVIECAPLFQADYKRLEDFLKKEFPFDFSEGEFIVDKVLDLLKQYKRLLMATTLPI